MKNFTRFVLTTLIFALCVTNIAFGREKEVLNAISGYKFGETIQGNKTKIPFSLKKSFLGFSKGFVYVDSRSRSVEAIELNMPLGIAVAKIPSEHKSLGSVSMSGRREEEEKRQERRYREERAADETFAQVLKALNGKYFLGEQPYFRTMTVSDKGKIYVENGDTYLEMEGDDYKSVRVGNGFSRSVVRKRLPKISLVRKIDKASFSPFGGTFGSGFSSEDGACPYGQLVKKFYAYDRDISDAENAVQLRTIYFCVDKQILKIVITNFVPNVTSRQKEHEEREDEAEETNAADALD